MGTAAPFGLLGAKARIVLLGLGIYGASMACFVRPPSLLAVSYMALGVLFEEVALVSPLPSPARCAPHNFPPGASARL